jgi:hypothetical protein
MALCFTLLLFLTEIVIIGYGQDQNPEKIRMKEALYAVKLPPCQACKVLVDSFKKVKLFLYGS